MTSPERLEPRRHPPPPDWPPDVFERLTDSLAETLLAALRRARDDRIAQRLPVDDPITIEAATRDEARAPGPRPT